MIIKSSIGQLRLDDDALATPDNVADIAALIFDDDEHALWERNAPPPPSATNAGVARAFLAWRALNSPRNSLSPDNRRELEALSPSTTVEFESACK